MTDILDVTQETFDREVLQSDVPVVVDFWADWCSPCRMLKPVLEQLAPELEGKVRFVKVDVDAEPTLVHRYGIKGIPVLLIFRGGVLLDHDNQRVVGYLQIEKLRTQLHRILDI